MMSDAELPRVFQGSDPLVDLPEHVVSLLGEAGLT